LNEAEAKLADYDTDYALTQALQAAAGSYDERFDKTFSLPAPFNTPEHKTFAKALTSNLIGGIGYYQGSSIVDRSFKHEYDAEDDGDDEDEDNSGSIEGPKLMPERELLTGTPSRSFFPRGFYWDEGFHLALIGEWDNDLR
jgi:mannosyl-oligosaccharide glucosidase